MNNENCFSRAVTVEVIVGVFVAAIFVALGIFTIVISGNSFFNNNQFPIQVSFDNAMGLRKNDPVLARGTPVGTVEKVFYEKDKVFVRATLTTPVVFREDYSITVQATSILGGRQLVLFEGNPEAEVVAEVLELEGDLPSDIMDDATAAVKYLRDFLAGDFLENLRISGEHLAEVSERLARGQGTLGKLFSEDDTLYRDLEEILASLKGVAQRLEKGEGTIGKLLSADETVYNDIKETMANLKEVTDRLERGEGTVGKLLSSDDEVYENLGSALADLRTISGRLERGEGTLGKLLSSDTELYDNINGAVGDVRETIDDMREVSPVSTFSSFIFGAF